MKEVKNLVKGPFKDEEAFKQAVLKVLRTHPKYKRFEIENEEKEPGMPDVLSISASLPSFFTEFKISDGKGIIEFTKDQPLFYKQNEDLLIDILAWDIRFNRVVALTPSEVLKALKANTNLKLRTVKIPEEL